jgi:hypothetical protein
MLITALLLLLLLLPHANGPLPAHTIAPATPPPPPPQNPTHYDILHVTPTSTPAEILSAHRVVARRAHPDKPGGSGPLMAAANEARDVLLGDAAQRCWYDSAALGRRGAWCAVLDVLDAMRDDGEIARSGLALERRAAVVVVPPPARGGGAPVRIGGEGAAASALFDTRTLPRAARVLVMFVRALVARLDGVGRWLRTAVGRAVRLW